MEKYAFSTCAHPKYMRKMSVEIKNSATAVWAHLRSRFETFGIRETLDQFRSNIFLAKIEIIAKIIENHKIKFFLGFCAVTVGTHGYFYRDQSVVQMESPKKHRVRKTDYEMQLEFTRRREKLRSFCQVKRLI